MRMCSSPQSVVAATLNSTISDTASWVVRQAHPHTDFGAWFSLLLATIRQLCAWSMLLLPQSILTLVLPTDESKYPCVLPLRSKLHSELGVGGDFWSNIKALVYFTGVSLSFCMTLLTLIDSLKWRYRRISKLASLSNAALLDATSSFLLYSNADPRMAGPVIVSKETQTEEPNMVNTAAKTQAPVIVSKETQTEGSNKVNTASDAYVPRMVSIAIGTPHTTAAASVVNARRIEDAAPGVVQMATVSTSASRLANSINVPGLIMSALACPSALKLSNDFTPQKRDAVVANSVGESADTYLRSFLKSSHTQRTIKAIYNFSQQTSSSATTPATACTCSNQNGESNMAIFDYKSILHYNSYWPGESLSKQTPTQQKGYGMKPTMHDTGYYAPVSTFKQLPRDAALITKHTTPKLQKPTPSFTCYAPKPSRGQATQPGEGWDFTPGNPSFRDDIERLERCASRMLLEAYEK